MNPGDDASRSIDLKTLPMPVMQALYHEITGKTETLIKGFKEARKITKPDIEQLSIKLHQICEQFSVVGENCTYNVRHVNSMTQKFSSLEKFKQYDESIPQAIDAIAIEFSVLIEVPATKKHYQYKIEVVLESLECDDTKKAPDVFWALFEYDSVKVKIEYVDYVVARTFLAAVEEWTQGLERLPSNVFWARLRRYLFPINQFNPLSRISEAAAALVALFTVFQLRDHFVISGDLKSLANFGMMSFLVYFITTRGASAAFSSFSARILRYHSPNLIVINRGDRDNFEKFKSQRSSFYYAAFLYFAEVVVIIALNLLSNKIYDFVK